MTISKFYSTWAVILLLAMAVTAEDEKESSIQMTDDENHDAKSSDYTRLTVERLRSLAQIQLQYPAPDTTTRNGRDLCRLMGELCNTTDLNVQCCDGLVCLGDSCAIVFSPPNP
ncbi:hypothetical protein MPTK1_6g11080 [Marchantia polymorpha subsp. ruderalis]|uniref:Uncharacterized protein n=2 Tax=Marchantia polymorpha TaxID=3197 RepID=A0AAF6BQT4_MARPO|nr:hypothetical protein MARPO_0016s0147 [Marchantia polymorpha]BBN14368.1 hypothetical protein Mp_6g11080 [Marchantia polymorpha subsp. ruderalis]|eukprot:PTQ45101.1 hypothetical protein MARPO_0016s0147 [Marchantia polymorpha]